MNPGITVAWLGFDINIDGHLCVRCQRLIAPDHVDAGDADHRHRYFGERFTVPAT